LRGSFRFNGVVPKRKQKKKKKLSGSPGQDAALHSAVERRGLKKKMISVFATSKNGLSAIQHSLGPERAGSPTFSHGSPCIFIPRWMLRTIRRRDRPRQLQTAPRAPRKKKKEKRKKKRAVFAGRGGPVSGTSTAKTGPPVWPEEEETGGSPFRFFF